MKRKSLGSLVLFVFILCIAHSERTIHYGIVFPSTASYSPMCRKNLDLGLERLKTLDILPSNVTIKFTPVDIQVENTNADNLRIIADAVFDHTKHLNALLGFYSSVTMQYVNIISEVLRRPLIGASITNPDFSDKTEYPYTARLCSSASDIAHSMKALLQHAKFDRAAVLVSDDTYGIGIVDQIKISLAEANIQLISLDIHLPLETHPPSALVSQIDLILDKLKAAGTKIFLYNAHYNETVLVLWRAYKKKMLGPQSDGDYQWIFGGTCYVGMITDCSIQECKDDLVNVRAALVGAMCTKADFSFEDWYKDIWKTETTVDKLSEAEIEISGSADWDKDQSPWANLQFDVPELMARATMKFCERYSSFDDCAEDLPNKALEFMDILPTINFDGASGNVQLDEQFTRLMNQQIMQWTGTDFERLATWIPGTSQSDKNSTLQFATHPIYGSQTGRVPSTTVIQHVEDWYAFVVKGLIGAIIVTVFVFGFLLYEAKRKRLGKSFFTISMVTHILIWSSMAVIGELLLSLLQISPDVNHIKISMFLEYFKDVPSIILLAIVISRVHLYYRVTRNRGLVRVRFSRFHTQFLALGFIVISLVGFMFRVYLIEESSGEPFSEKLFRLQDSFPYHYFTVTTPEYYKYSVSSDSGYAEIISSPIYLAVLYGIFAWLSAATSKGHFCKRVFGKDEMVEISYCATICFFCCGFQAFEDTLSYGIAGSQTTQEHFGFENGDSVATLERMRMELVFHVSR
eukprot:TRINITY_DN46689_c0_g2_i1.p1 TRINITY_DN46689_c0_g2~~TRINITY_DN46689_c0_g2_i1.p1  ORF type:complete len:746 (+),score=115.74 TRINITY_DN46689_c0_g2_i1:95-2332(+)